MFNAHIVTDSKQLSSIIRSSRSIRTRFGKQKKNMQQTNIYVEGKKELNENSPTIFIFQKTLLVFIDCLILTFDTEIFSIYDMYKNRDGRFVTTLNVFGLRRYKRYGDWKNSIAKFQFIDNWINEPGNEIVWLINFIIIITFFIFI